jgi:hypothetical protein
VRPLSLLSQTVDFPVQLTASMRDVGLFLRQLSDELRGPRLVRPRPTRVFDALVQLSALAREHALLLLKLTKQRS